MEKLMINKKWIAYLSFMIGTLLYFSSLNFSSFAMDGMCDDHSRGRISRNSGCNDFYCKANLAIAHKTLQRLAVEPCRTSQFMVAPQQSNGWTPYNSYNHYQQSPAQQYGTHNLVSIYDIANAVNTPHQPFIYTPVTPGDVWKWEENNNTI